MDPLLFTFEEIAGFVAHPDKPVRRWAQDRLLTLFPERAAEVLTAQLGDEDFYLALRAAEVIGDSGDAARYGPLVLEHMQRAPAAHFAALAEAAAQLELAEALPLIVAHSRRQDIPSSAPGWFLRLTHALGRYGHAPEARQRLWELLSEVRAHPAEAGMVIDALLYAVRPDEVPRLVRGYRALPFDRRMVRAFGGPAGANRTIDETGYVLSQGFDAVMGRIGDWLGRQLPVSPDAYNRLRSAFAKPRVNIFTLLLGEARRLMHKRGDDEAAWRAAWEAGEALVGYRLQAVYTLGLLEAFAAERAVGGEQRQAEAAMGLALLAQLGVDQDDQGRLETTSDELIMLLAILTENRENILPTVIDRLVEMGPAVLPGLVSLLSPAHYGWGATRALQIVTLLARRHPGSCDVLIPFIIEMVFEGQGDFACEAAAEALAVIGPAAVTPITQHLDDGDSTRYIYLTGALSEIPTEASAQALLKYVPLDQEPDEMEIINLADTGSIIALEPLYRLAKRYRDNPFLAGNLLVLCALNGVDKPELSQWREFVVAEDERMDALVARPDRPLPTLAETRDILEGMGLDLVDEDIRAMFDVAPDPEPESRKRVQHLEPPAQSSRKSQQISREERKRRKDQRKRTQRGG
jgi:hypothetical protein